MQFECCRCRINNRALLAGAISLGILLPQHASAGGEPHFPVGNYEVFEINESELVTPDIRITMNVTDRRSVNGLSSCNRYTAVYSLVDEEIKFDKFRVTRKKCLGPKMKIESIFFNTIKKSCDWLIDGFVYFKGKDKCVIKMRLI